MVQDPTEFENTDKSLEKINFVTSDSDVSSESDSDMSSDTDSDKLTLVSVTSDSDMDSENDRTKISGSNTESDKDTPSDSDTDSDMHEIRSAFGKLTIETTVCNQKHEKLADS